MRTVFRVIARALAPAAISAERKEPPSIEIIAVNSGNNVVKVFYNVIQLCFEFQYFNFFGFFRLLPILARQVIAVFYNAMFARVRAITLVSVYKTVATV